jgi:hypothetical protein
MCVCGEAGGYQELPEHEELGMADESVCVGVWGGCCGTLPCLVMHCILTSSMTRILHACSLHTPLLERSRMRPGVATTT